MIAAESDLETAAQAEKHDHSVDVGERKKKIAMHFQAVLLDRFGTELMNCW